MAAPRPRKINANGRGRIRESNEQRLLQAAETVFAERGFTGATTAAIAAKARLPKANLHYYFRTKAELYRAVLANVLELWLDELDRFTPEREPAEAIATGRAPGRMPRRSLPTRSCMARRSWNPTWRATCASASSRRRR